jgi:hypothetical protein
MSEPASGRNIPEAGGPMLIPVPSLLQSLLSSHLDPGYAAAASSKQQRSTSAEWTWQVLAAVVVAAVFALAWAQAHATASLPRWTPNGAAASRATPPEGSCSPTSIRGAPRRRRHR